MDVADFWSEAVYMAVRIGTIKRSLPREKRGSGAIIGKYGWGDR